MANKDPRQVTTGKVRFSYVNIWEPKASQDGGDPKYSTQILIPKSDTVTMGKIKAAMAAAREDFVRKNGAASLPANPINPVHDGDGTKPNSGEPYGPECKGCYVINVSSKQAPKILDASLKEITDPAAVYSGCYGLASINFYGYNNRKKGIGAGLRGIVKLHDGEPLGGNVCTTADFEDAIKDYAPDALLGEFDDLLG